MASVSDLRERVWLGPVVDNNDPEQLGRCRIKVYSLFDELEDSAVPWSFPVSNNSFAGGAGGFGSLSIPKIGTIVRVQFSEGNIYSPEYYGIQTINRAMQADIADSYLNSHVVAYDEDEQLKIYYTPSRGVTIFHKESQIVINPDSSITIEHAGSSSIIELVGSTINIVAASDVNITAPKAVVDAGSIELGAGAFEAVIKGNAFLDFFNLHSHPAPNAPPSVAMPSALLSKTTKTK